MTKKQLKNYLKKVPKYDLKMITISKAYKLLKVIALHCI